MTTKAKSSLAALALLAALGLGASGAAQAGHDDMDVFWSIAMSQPGIRIGVSNMPAAPVVVHERHHVYERPVYVPPPRVVYLPPHPVYRAHPGYDGHGYGHRDGHWRDRDRGHGGGRGPEMHMGNRR